MCSAHVRTITFEMLPCSLQKQLDLLYTLMLVHVQLLQSLCESSLLQHMLERTLNMFWPPASGTQVKDSLLAALFNGRWESSHTYDSEGRIFLDYSLLSKNAELSTASCAPQCNGEEPTRS